MFHRDKLIPRHGEAMPIHRFTLSEINKFD